MPDNHLPKNWTVSKVSRKSDVYTEAPQSQDDSHIQFYGVKDHNFEYQLYSIPANTPIEDVIRFFNVGSHVNNGYGFHANETIDLVIKKTKSISEIIPYRVIFADASGLKLKFTRPITQNELKKIEAFFPEDEYYQAGLERYLSEWDGESSILAPITKENLIHFWWD